MARFAKTALAGILSVVMTGPVWGQAATQGSARATAQVRTPQGAGGISQTPWFSNQMIRSQLNLTPQQYNALNSAYGQAYTHYSGNMGQLGNSLTPQEREQKMQDLRANFDRSINAATQKVITDPQTQQRFNQLALQYQGFNAFTNSQIQQKLNLTAQQRQQLTKAADQYNQQLMNLERGAQTNPQATSSQFSTLRQQATQNINTILTPQQQQTWRQLTGEPYNFQWSNYHPSTTGR